MHNLPQNPDGIIVAHVLKINIIHLWRISNIFLLVSTVYLNWDIESL